MATLAELGAASRALYRSLLRTARRMPDDHRTAFVLHKVRSDFDKARSLDSLDEIATRQLQGEIYRDQLEHQAEHLNLLAQQETLIPVDLRSARPPPSSPSSPSTPSRSGPSRPSRPSRPCRPSRSPPSSDPAPIPAPSAPLDRRKLIRAIAARRESEKTAARGGVAGLRRNRFMEGPEPSWIRRRKEQEEGKEPGKAAGGCGCGDGHAHGVRNA